MDDDGNGTIFRGVQVLVLSSNCVHFSLSLCLSSYSCCNASSCSQNRISAFSWSILSILLVAFRGGVVNVADMVVVYCGGVFVCDGVNVVTVALW